MPLHSSPRKLGRNKRMNTIWIEFVVQNTRSMLCFLCVSLDVYSSVTSDWLKQVTSFLIPHHIIININLYLFKFIFIPHLLSKESNMTCCQKIQNMPYMCFVSIVIKRLHFSLSFFVDLSVLYMCLCMRVCISESAHVGMNVCVWSCHSVSFSVSPHFFD